MITEFRNKIRLALFIILSFLCLWPAITTPLALLMGLSFAFLLGCPSPTRVQHWSKILLQASVVGLGFGIGIKQVLETGKDGLPIAIGTILLALVLGFVLYKVLQTSAHTSALISVGTAICGGSAIAAIAPIIRAKPEQISVSMAAVFSLNAVALIIFPWVGHQLSLSPEQFGLWSALAIHDTSSVVGAASVFGETALAVGTTVKLTRVIWIIPIALLIAIFERNKGKISIPWFVVLFLVAAGLRSLLPSFTDFFDSIHFAAKQSLCVVLFWIGAGLNKESLSKVGIRPFVLAILLWVILALVSLYLAQMA